MSEYESIIENFIEKFGASVEVNIASKDMVVPKDKLFDACTFLKSRGFDHLSTITAVDKTKGHFIEVIYILYSYGMRDSVTLKTRIGRGAEAVKDKADEKKDKWGKDISDNPDNLISPSDLENKGFEICVGCGLCNKQCPKGIDVKGVLVALKKGEKISAEQIDSCIKCNLCAEKCPKKIKILEIFEEINKISSGKISAESHVKSAILEEDYVLPSVTSLYGSSDWYEREVYDMFGIKFSGHPNLKRILLNDAFEGHPLRKSYPLEKEQPVDMLKDFELSRDDVNADKFVEAERKKGREFETRVMHINMGPQHPSTHGVLRLRILVEGEQIVKMYPVIGYLHRGVEKIAENLNFMQFTPYLDRLDYVASMLNEFPYVLGLEKLVGVEVPERAQHIRVAMAELNRIASHLMWVATWPMDLGAITPFFYCFREREKVLEIYEELCGARMMYNYMRFGGVRNDLNEKTTNKIYRFLDSFPEHLKEYHELLTGNEIFLSRAKGIGVLKKEDALGYGVTGPILRACGMDYDIRKAHPYSMYDKFKFRVPVYNEGDNYARYLVRMEEMEESVKIVKQAMDSMPEGHFMAKVPRVITPPIGSVYSKIEHAKGEMGIYIVSNGTMKPERLKIRSPSFSNLSILPHLLEGENIADVVAISGTIDPVMGCVDR